MPAEPVSRKNLAAEGQRARLHTRALLAASACLRRECCTARVRLKNLRLRALLDLDLALQPWKATSIRPMPPDGNPPGAGTEISPSPS